MGGCGLCPSCQGGEPCAGDLPAADASMLGRCEVSNCHQHSICLIGVNTITSGAKRPLVCCSHTEDGSSSQLLDTAPLPPLTAMPPPDAISVTLSGMLQAAQAEITVQALEADLSSDPSVVRLLRSGLKGSRGSKGVSKRAHVGLWCR